MESEVENEHLRRLIMSAPPGTVLTIARPATVNVELTLDPSWASEFERVLLDPRTHDADLPCVSERNATGLPTRAIVPLFYTASNADWHERTIFGNRQLGYPPSRVQVRDYIKCEMGFAVTIHKAGMAGMRLASLCA